MMKFKFRLLTFLLAAVLSLVVALLMCYNDPQLALIQNWNTKPLFLRTAFVVLAPIFLVLFWIAGFSFEYRTFGEIYLLSVCLLVPNQWLRFPA